MFEGPGDSGRGNRALVIGAALTALWLVMLLVIRLWRCFSDTQSR